MATDGLRAIVTGSASGLGAASALKLAKTGAKLVINYASSKSEAEQVADQCRAAGAEVVVVQGDVSRDEDCKRIVAAATAWGGLDVLINNAGATKHVEHSLLDQLSAEDFQRIYSVNIIGPFQMVRASRAPLIRVNAVCPGYIDTPWFEKGRGVEGAKRVRDMVKQKVALKVASGPQDIAELVCFLAGPQSGHMSGELVRMDAGMHLAT